MNGFFPKYRTNRLLQDAVDSAGFQGLHPGGQNQIQVGLGYGGDCGNAPLANILLAGHVLT
jgi:hypothetical protein